MNAPSVVVRQSFCFVSSVSIPVGTRSLDSCLTSGVLRFYAQGWPGVIFLKWLLQMDLHFFFLFHGCELRYTVTYAHIHIMGGEMNTVVINNLNTSKAN